VETRHLIPREKPNKSGQDPSNLQQRKHAPRKRPSLQRTMHRGIQDHAGHSVHFPVTNGRNTTGRQYANWHGHFAVDRIRQIL